MLLGMARGSFGVTERPGFSKNKIYCLLAHQGASTPLQAHSYLYALALCFGRKTNLGGTGPSSISL